MCWVFGSFFCSIYGLGIEHYWDDYDILFRAEPFLHVKWAEAKPKANFVME